MSFDFGTTVDGAGDFRFLQGLSVEVREETQIGGWRFQRLSHWTIAFGIGAVTACAIPQIDGASLSNIVSPSEPTATCQQYHCDTGENDRLFSYKQLMCPADKPSARFAYIVLRPTAHIQLAVRSGHSPREAFTHGANHPIVDRIGWSEIEST